jgi:hypothetical protein
MYEEHPMTELAKLTIKTVIRTSNTDPKMQRRAKLIAAIEEQAKVLAAALKGEAYQVKKSSWMKNADGEKVAVEKMRQVRAWFFEQDGGWYVQCRYGSKILDLGKGNAVFVKALKDVDGVLETFLTAANAGELDAAIEAVLAKRKAA